jgi:hypothetical protein
VVPESDIMEPMFADEIIAHCVADSERCSASGVEKDLCGSLVVRAKYVKFFLCEVDTHDGNIPSQQLHKPRR